MKSWSPLRMPTFWLLLGTVALTGLATALLSLLYVWNAPRAAAVAMPPLVAYTIGCLLVLRRLDHLGRRPWWLVTLAFLWGATGSIVVGAGAGWFTDELLGKLTSPEFAATWGAAITAPTAEETAKGAGVVLLLLAARPHLRTVVSGAVYGGIIGLGFGVLEDGTYAWGAADETLPDDIGEALRILVLRFTTPGLFSHFLFTAVVGAGIAYFAVRTDRSLGRRWAVLAGAYAVAWLTHATNNSPLAFLATNALDALPGFAGMAGFFLAVGLPGGVGLAWLARIRRTEATAVTGQLATGTAPAASEAEAAVLASSTARALAVRQVRRAYGPPAARAARRVQRALLRLSELRGAGLYGAPAALTAPTAPVPTPPPGPPLPAAFGAPFPAGTTTHPAATHLAPAYSAPTYPTAPIYPGAAYPAPAWTPQWTVAPPVVPPSPEQPLLTELTEARAELGRLTGTTEVPAPRAEPYRPAWLGWVVIVLALVGLVHWAVALVAVLVAAVPLVLSRIRLRPVPQRLLWGAFAAGASGYIWLVSLLLNVLYPEG